MRNLEELPECPIATFTVLLGNKWKLMIIRDLLQKETFFGELQRDLYGISHKVLTENLRALEADGLVKRTVYDGVPARVSYTMTEFGMSLAPIYDVLPHGGIPIRNFYDRRRSRATKFDCKI